MILAVILDVFRCSINCGIFKAWHYLITFFIGNAIFFDLPIKNLTHLLHKSEIRPDDLFVK